VKRENVKDFYFHKAKRENFSARSVYKLQDIQNKYKLIKPKDAVLDLGAAPGSWSEYLAEVLKPSGRLTALDQNDLSAAAHQKIKSANIAFHFLEQSVFDPLPAELGKFDVIVSDMAPSTQGSRFIDTQNSLTLIERAYEIAQKQLKLGGHFVVKLFQSQETVDATKTWKKSFQHSKLYRPPAVHKESKEVYFIGQIFKVTSPA
jgi:23S rRNA (uridine2552-2'-O)-methyltransferase